MSSRNLSKTAEKSSSSPHTAGVGGDMSRPCTQNLALPIFDFATLSTLITTHHNGPKIGNTMGQFPKPPAMELLILVTLEHHKFPG
jgi:hypothetical protein